MLSIFRYNIEYLQMGTLAWWVVLSEGMKKLQSMFFVESEHFVTTTSSHSL